MVFDNEEASAPSAVARKLHQRKSTRRGNPNGETRRALFASGGGEMQKLPIDGVRRVSFAAGSQILMGVIVCRPVLTRWARNPR